MFSSIEPGRDFYFVHSYVLNAEHVADISATTHIRRRIRLIRGQSIRVRGPIPSGKEPVSWLSSVAQLPVDLTAIDAQDADHAYAAVQDFGLVKGVSFDSWRRVGSAMQSVKVYNLRQVDELILFDIRATDDGRGPDLEMVDELADECFMPLTVGGGVRTIEDVRGLLMVGADKISMNTAAIERPELVRETRDRFGSQCVVVSINARRESDGTYQVYSHAGNRPTGRDPVETACVAERMGAGEILLTSIDRDGTMQGYDCDLTSLVADAVEIPVIASGGAGTYMHMAALLRDTKASAVAAASMFHFTEQTPLEAKRYLAAQGFPMRL